IATRAVDQRRRYRSGVDQAPFARLDAARGQLLALAGDPGAEDVLRGAWSVARAPFTDGERDRAPPALSAYERVEILLAMCEYEATHTTQFGFSHSCDLTNRLVANLHPKAPVAGRMAVASAAASRRRNILRLVGPDLERAVDIFVAAGAAPLLIATTRWDLARAGPPPEEPVRRAHATEAAAIFTRLGRADTAAEIEAWLEAGAPVDPAPEP
ncbi:MAG: hypothetical protein KIT31_37245, partial [Deltaproteobacteria bacterium]|nr:hypothetical protein [Deltaproteobacteria bacterium]